jgi:CheY-like chemotaxis protein
MLTDLLSDLGHTVVAAENGAEAVVRCASDAPDLMILDFLMPKLSGLDALREIRRAGHPVPMVLLTAISDGSLRGVDGADQVDVKLEKPFTRKTLERAIARAVRAR